MAERKPGAAASPTRETVSGADWYARDLAAERHEHVLFVDVDLAESASRGASFTSCTFRRTRFNVSTHVDTAFVNCTFANCSFFDARLTECKFVGSVFERCEYDLLQVAGGNWSHVGMPEADLRRAAFRGVRLREADLTGARLQGAAVRDCDLSGAWLGAALLAKCDLRGSDLTGIDVAQVELRGAIVTFEQAVVLASALGMDVRPD